MKKNLLCLLFLSVFMFSCNTDDIVENELASNQGISLESNSIGNHGLTLKSSSIKNRVSTLGTRSIQYSLFQNVEQFTTGTSVFGLGEIYCSEATSATLEFFYQGNPGTSYNINMPNTGILRPSNGASRRTVTIKLDAGINKFSVQLLFNAPFQRADLRLVLISIAGDNSLDGEGYVDLVAQGSSEIWDPGASKPLHTKCSSCGFLNSTSAPKCVSCGK
jgi:hypothetical protein